MRTIRVTGKGQLKVKPDMTRITLTLEGRHHLYDEVLRRSSKDTEQLKDLLAGFGFERSELKTRRFNVETEYESYKEKGAYKQRFTGYRYVHVVKVEFASDNDRLGRVMYALARSPLEPEFRISYTTSDPEGSKNELLGRAVSDAKAKAAVLTQAAGVALKEIQSVDYSWGEIEFETSPMARGLEFREIMLDSAVGTGSYDLDIEPDDIEVSDTVTVLWEIG